MAFRFLIKAPGFPGDTSVEVISKLGTSKPKTNECCVCCEGEEYWNDSTLPIQATLLEDPDEPGNYYWTYDGHPDKYVGRPPESTPVENKYRKGMRPICIRVLVYDNAVHDGSTYTTLGGLSILGPWLSGDEVPNESKFMNDCWNWHKYEFDPVHRPGDYFTSGLSKTFTVDAQRLFDALRPDLCGIPEDVRHHVQLVCVTWKLYLKSFDTNTYAWYELGSTRINPKARWYPCMYNDDNPEPPP